MNDVVGGFELQGPVRAALPDGFEDLPGDVGGLLRFIRESRCAVNRWEAGIEAAVSEVYRIRHDEHVGRASDAAEWGFVDDCDVVQAEVGAAAGLTRGAAGYALERAADLRERVPGVLGLMRAGLLTLAQAKAVVAQSKAIMDPELVAAFDTRITERLRARLSKEGAAMTVRAVRSAAARLVAEIDPDARLEQPPGRKPYLAFTPLPNGMVAVDALMERPVAERLGTAIEQVAGSVCRKDGRSLPEREVAALIALVDGFVSLGCECGREGCEQRERRPRTGAVAPTPKADVVVVLNETTLRGADDLPATVLASGGLLADTVVTADAARGMLRRCRTRVRPLGRRRADGTVAAAAGSGYRPTGAQLMVMRLRYHTCVFPHCSVPAVKCQADHVVEYNHRDPTAGGPTAVGNMVPLCGFHHRIKTDSGWLSDVLADGTVEWIDPTGNRYLTGLEHGTDHFPALDDLVWQPARQPATEPKNPDGEPGRAERRNAERERLREQNRQIRRRRDVDAGREPDGPPPF